MYGVFCCCSEWVSVIKQTPHSDVTCLKLLFYGVITFIGKLMQKLFMQIFYYLICCCCCCEFNVYFCKMIGVFLAFGCDKTLNMEFFYLLLFKGEHNNLISLSYTHQHILTRFGDCNFFPGHRRAWEKKREMFFCFMGR